MLLQHLEGIKLLFFPQLVPEGHRYVCAVELYLAIQQVDFTYAVRTLLQIGCLIWGSVEALRYSGLLKRRMRLGL